MKNTASHLMSQAQLQRWAKAANITPAGIALISRIRSSDPVRRTEGRNSVRGFYSSTKVGLTIQFESHGNEYITVQSFEFDPDVLEYRDQASKMKLSYTKANGTKGGFFHTPDFFVIRKGSAGWVECKPEEKLHALAKKDPARYVRDGSGVWHCPPAEEYARKLGLTYEIRSSAKTPHIHPRNMTFLEDYIRRDYPEMPRALVETIRTTVAKQQGISYADLLAALKGKTSSDDLNYMIIENVIFADLGRQLLIHQHDLKLFTDRGVAEVITQLSENKGLPATTPVVTLTPNTHVLLEGKHYTIFGFKDSVVSLLDESGHHRFLKETEFELLVIQGAIKGVEADSATARENTVQTILSTASPAQTLEAANRWKTIQPCLTNGQGRRKPRTKSRSVRRWVAAYKKAEFLYGNGYVGLIPQISRGNTKPKLEARVVELIDQHLKSLGETAENRSASYVHGQLLLACEAEGLACPSFNTFLEYRKARPVREYILKSKGKRFAEKMREFVYFIDRTVPVHGDRPWEVSHIDHTELDIELVCSQTGHNLGRPWLTLMMDAFSRRVLAFHLSFFGPNADSGMRVFRESVRRFNRLPQTVVVDNGRDFDSAAFEVFLAAYKIHKKSRPPGKPQFGSLLERLFGTTNTIFVHNLVGNTKLTKNVRMVTKSVDPARRACWTLEEFSQALSEFFFEVYDQKDHPALGGSPRATYDRAMNLFGERSHTLIPFDNRFYIQTLPTTKSGRSQIHHQKGIHLNYLDYWCQAFRDPRWHGRSVPVRYDPDDASVAYAYVAREWVECHSTRGFNFNNVSKRSVETAAMELRAQQAGHARRRQITAKHIADFMKKVAQREDVLRRRAQELAMKAVSFRLKNEQPEILTPANCSSSSPNEVEHHCSSSQQEPVSTESSDAAEYDLSCDVTLED